MDGLSKKRQMRWMEITMCGHWRSISICISSGKHSKLHWLLNKVPMKTLSLRECDVAFAGNEIFSVK
jgi:hypothetical protein